jgi:hypothetical protein
VGRGEFIRGQIVTVFSQCGKRLYLRGNNLTGVNWKEEVVNGPFYEEEVEEYVPPAPAKTLEEKVKEIWP